MGELSNGAFITELERNLNAKASEGVRFIVRERHTGEPTESEESKTASHVVQCVRFGVISQIFVDIIFYSEDESREIYVKILFDAYSQMNDFIGKRSEPSYQIINKLRHVIQYKLDIAYMVECIVKNRIKDALKTT